MHELFKETELDRLQDLHKKRLDEIAIKGTDFTISDPDHPVKGLLDYHKNLIVFPPTAGIRAGITISSKTGNYYITEITGKVGMVFAQAMPVKGEVDLMTPKHGGYTKAGTQPVLGTTAGDISLPAWGAPGVGAVIKHHGALRKVVAARREGPVTTIRTEPVQVATAPKTKHVDSRNFVNASHMSTAKAYGMYSY